MRSLAPGQAPLVGGKAANLAALLQAGLPVPEGFCITTAAFHDWLKHSRTLRSQTRRPDLPAPESSEPSPAQAAAWREFLATVPVPPTVARALCAALQSSVGFEACAVRSSATVEDLPEASFAGQHDSVLNVRGPEAVLAAVRRCWISLFSDRALAYRARRTIPASTIAMAVVVQPMVPARSAGVLFTLDPVSGDPNTLVIEAVPGLGETLVAGRVNPERWRIDRHTLAPLTPLPAPAQPSLSRFHPDRASVGGAAEKPPAVPCLDAAQIAELGQLGLTVERLFGCPQDIEWAAQPSQLFLLQARPITNPKEHPAPRGPQEPEIWTRANVMEALPEAITPMAWSLMDVLVRDFLTPLLRRAGLESPGRPLVGVVSGHAYLNARAVFKLIQGIAGSRAIDISTAFGGHFEQWEPLLWTDGTRRPPWWSLGHWIELLRIGLWLVPGLFHQQRLMERWGARIFTDEVRASPSSRSDEALAELPFQLLRQATLDRTDRTWAAAAWMGAAAVGGSHAVLRLARRWLGDTDGSLGHSLLAGAPGMNSADNGRALQRLAAWTRERSGLTRMLLEPGAFAQVSQDIGKLPEGREFLQRWEAFMERHGHQARGGMDIAQPRWSETPDFVLDMLRTLLRSEGVIDPVLLEARLQTERDALWSKVGRQLRNPFKRTLLKFLIRVSRRGLTQRENVKNDGVRMVAVLRHNALEAGTRLVRRGILEQPEDVFFLRFEELAAALRNDPELVQPGLVAARKTEHAYWSQHPPPLHLLGQQALQTPVPTSSNTPGATLQGLGVCAGIVTGRARVILQADAHERLEPGEILVAPYTDPGWTPYFLVAAGLVVEVGGLLSHGSVVAREYGLPAVVNVPNATVLIQTGQLLRIDGSRGLVERVL